MEHDPNAPIRVFPHSEFQVQALLERVLRRPVWRVRREADMWLVQPTAHEQSIAVMVADLDGSMVDGNFRATIDLQKTLLQFHDAGIPDMNGEDISGRVTPPPHFTTGLALLRMIFHTGPDDRRLA